LAGGEQPYVDFLWQYPPLGLWLFGWVSKSPSEGLLGIEILLCALSTGVVFLCRSIAKRFVGELASSGIALVALVVGALAMGPYTLFSLRTYSPAVPVGVLGFLWLLLLVVDLVRAERPLPGKLASFVAASTVCLLSKPEFMLAWAVVIVALVVLLHRRGARKGETRREQWTRVAVFASSGIPAAMVYAVLAFEDGFSNLKDGILGYGVAKLVCPWWPTGIGLIGAGTAVLQAIALHALFRRAFGGASEKRRALVVWLFATSIATLIYVAILFRTLDKALTPRTLVGYLLNLGTWLLVAQWGSIIAGVRLLREYLAGRAIDEGLLLLTVGVSAVAFRGLFGSNFEWYPSVHFSALILAALVGMILLVTQATADAQTFGHVSRLNGFWALGAVICLIRAALYHSMEPQYTALPAGFHGLTVAEDAEDCAEIFKYVDEQPQASVADIAYGGVVNMMTERRGNTLMTQYQLLNPSPELRSRDLERFRAAKPDLVIAHKGPNFETMLGIPLPTHCEFPRIVWRTTAQACAEPPVEYPVVDEIKARYEPVMDGKNHEILRRIDRGEQSVAPARATP
jgi:hypothetical protein